jgi:hypothetical protein
MKKYEAVYLPAGSYDPSKKGFKTVWHAWDYIYTKICDKCKVELNEKGDEAFAPCLAEWMVYEEE